MYSPGFYRHDQIKRIRYNFVKKVKRSFRRSKHDQSTVERTLPRAILLLGLMSRDLTTLGLFVLIFLIFGNSDMVKWSDRPKGAIFSGLLKN